MFDIFSRYIVAAQVHVSKSGELATDVMKEMRAIRGAPHVVHADRGTTA